MNRIKFGFGVGTLALATGLLGCASEAGIETGDEPLDSVGLAHTGANPKVDAEYRTTITPATGGNPSWGYRDIAVSNSHFFLSRVDGLMERRLFTVSAPFDSWVSSGEGFGAISYVDGTWGVVGAKDATGKIWRKLDTTPQLLGNYPGGVTSVGHLAATPTAAGLKIFIMHSAGPGGGLRVLREGEYRTIDGAITWQATTGAYGMYNTGLALADGKPHAILNFEPVRFLRYTPPVKQNPSWTSVQEQIAPFTEHAYLHPDGANDRFAAPIEYRAADGYFYAIDTFVNAGTSKWVIARLAKANIVF